MFLAAYLWFFASGHTVATRSGDVHEYEATRQTVSATKPHILFQSRWYVRKSPDIDTREDPNEVVDPHLLQSVAAAYESDVQEIKSLLGQDGLKYSEMLQRSLDASAERTAHHEKESELADGDSPLQATTQEAATKHESKNASTSTVAEAKHVNMTQGASDTSPAADQASTSDAQHSGGNSSTASNSSGYLLPLLEAAHLDPVQSISLGLIVFVAIFGGCLLLASPCMVPCIDSDNMLFHVCIDVSILLNAVVICAELRHGESHLTFILENIFNCIFLFEVCLRLQDAGLRKFMRTPWDVFNLLLVVAGSLDLWILPIIDTGFDGAISEDQNLKEAVGLCRILRILRIVRLFRPKPLPPPWRIEQDFPAEAWFSNNREKGKGKGKSNARRKM